MRQVILNQVSGCNMGIFIVWYRTSCHPLLKVYQGRRSAIAIIGSPAVMPNLGQEFFETLFVGGIQFR